MTRLTYSIDDILKEIPDSQDGAGIDLTLTTIYDDIKNARVEEDERLSLGVWERDLKKADWETVEKLSIEALTEKTKDLQIVGWLMESLIVMDEFSGIFKGMSILNAFLETFWNSSYPKNEDNTSDDEQKLRILEWLYDTINKKFCLINFLKYNDKKISIYNYDYAVELASIIKRSPTASSEIVKSAKKDNIKTLDEIQNIIKASDDEYLRSVLDDVKNIQNMGEILCETIKKVTNNNSIIAFSDLISNLSKIEKILTPYLINNIPVDNPPIIPIEQEKKIKHMISINKRDEIYEQIGELAKELQNIEKHSPSHYILNLVVSWKNKNLLEIMMDLKSGETEAHKLLKILLNH